MPQEIASGEPRNPKEPLISTHGNITLIGIEHFANPAELQFTTTDLETLLSESEDLYLESGNVDNVDLDKPSQSYTDAALQFFIRDGKKDKVHFFENGVDKIALATTYGIDARTAFLASLINVLFYQSQGKTIDPEIYTEERLDQTISQLQEYFPSIGDISDDVHIKKAALDFVSSMKDTSSQAYKDLFFPARAVQMHMVDIRDFEIIIPQVKKLAESDGKKAIMVGVRHAEDIGPVLNGQEMRRPADWQTAQYGFNGKEREQIEQFTKRANGTQNKTRRSLGKLQPPWRKQ